MFKSHKNDNVFNDQVSLNVVAAFNLAFAQEQQCASDIQFNGSKL